MNTIQDETMNRTANKFSIKDLVMTGMFTALICVTAQLVIPIEPVPFTFALVTIFLAGALLTPRNALLSVLVYLLLGAFGLPVFAGMTGGPQILTGMTGGYLMAYPFMAFIPALCYKYSYKYSKRKRIAALSISMVVSLILCYTLGTLWFTFVTGTGFSAALVLCVYPFVPFDLLKIALAVVLGVVLRRTALKQFYQN